MDPSASYHYAYPPRQKSPPANARAAGPYQNSSAFSASANPDEDWTKISDLAERRRIQNRIAQRNYRKKLKRRLEDLEKRTSSSSTSPEQAPREMVKPSQPLVLPTDGQSQQRRASRCSNVSGESQYSPEIVAAEYQWSEHATPAAAYTYTTPHVGAFSEYQPPPTEYFPVEFPSNDYTQMQSMYPHHEYSHGYVSHTSPPMPSMPAVETLKSDPRFGSNEGEMLGGFNMNYASLAGINLPGAQPPSEYALRTPSLTDELSFLSESRSCSPAFFTMPLTPESRPATPEAPYITV